MRKTKIGNDTTVLGRPTLDDIKKWPATVNVESASKALGFSRSHGFNLIRTGSFPAKVIPAGGRYLVVTASIVALLSSETGDAA